MMQDILVENLSCLGENRAHALSVHFITYPHTSPLVCTETCFMDQETKMLDNTFLRAQDPVTVKVQARQPQSLCSNHLAMCPLGGLAGS